MTIKRTPSCLFASLLVIAAGLTACSKKDSATPQSSVTRPKLGIRAQADETIHPDLSKTRLGNPLTAVRAYRRPCR